VADRELLLIEIREDGARVVKRNLTELGSVGDKTTGQMDKLKAAIAGLISLKAAKQVIEIADSYTNMLNRLRVVTTGTWELHAAMKAIQEMSRETRTSLEGNVEMYNRIAINTKQMGLGMKEVTRFAKQLNHAIILSGVTAREAHWGMVQFSQGLAAGALRGDELRAVMEQLPVVTQTLTKFLGIGRGELRKWAFEGRVTTQVIIDAFNDAEKSLAERFGKRIPTVEQAIVVLRNAWVSFVGSIDQGIQGTAALARAIMWVADNMDVLGRIAVTVGTVFGSIFLVNLTKIVAQMKLFSLSILTVNPMATAIIAASAALVVFSDKLEVSAESGATLRDVFTALGEKAGLAYKVMRDGAIELATQMEPLQGEAKSMWQTMVDDVAWFIDGVIGLFTGASAVIRWIFDDIPNHGARAWNGLLSGFEVVIDYITAAFASIGDMFRMVALNLDTAMNNLALSMQHVWKRQWAKAAEYGDQAALSFSNAAKAGMSGFGDALDRNLQLAAKEDSLAGARAQIKEAGKSMGEVFIEGFGEASFASDILKRADEIAGAAGAQRPAPNEKVFSPTPVQNELLKSMSGNATKLNNQVAELAKLWEAINTKQPGTEGMAVDLDMMNRKMAELKTKAMEVNTDVVSGFQRGFNKFALEITNFADMAEKTIVNAFKSMEDALVDFVTTGKVDFKSLVDSMLADLTRLLARQAIAGLIGSMAGGEGSGGLLGMIAGTASGGDAAGSVTPRAYGGSVSPGQDYIVGERRPEIFTPAQPGHITPQVTAQQPAAEPSITIINVSSEEEAIAAMQSAEGTRVIRNEIRKAGKGIN
jgi:tape measure domain-containing protein